MTTINLTIDPHLSLNNITVDIAADGVINARWSGRYMLQHEAVERITHIASEELGRAARLPDGQYYRCCNSRDEYAIAQAGGLRNSINHADGAQEAGVSVAEGTPHYLINGYSYCYIVEGEVVGTGSDGEPLLAPHSVRPVSRLMTARAAHKAYQDKLARVLRSLGWSIEQYRDIHGCIDSHRVINIEISN